jgi:DNA replication protein DnaC
VNREDWIVSRVAAVTRRLPAVYQDLRLEHAEVTEWCVEVLTGSARSLLLVGPKGTGKTACGWLAYPHLVALGWVGKFFAVTEVDFLDSCLHDPHSRSQARSADVLLLDDLGGASVSDWSRSRLLSLLHARWLDRAPTIVTTNLTQPQLLAHLGDRASSRLADGARMVTLTGADRRIA